MYNTYAGTVVDTQISMSVVLPLLHVYLSTHIILFKKLLLYVLSSLLYEAGLPKDTQLNVFLF